MVIVDSNPGHELTRSGVEDEIRGIGTLEIIGQRVFRIDIRRADRATKVDGHGRDGIADVLRKVSHDGVAVEPGRAVCPGPSDSGLGPRTVAFVVCSPNLHLIFGPGVEARYGRARACDLPRSVGPSACGSFPVLQVVAQDLRPAGIGRGRPADRQAGLAFRYRGQHRSSGCQRRFVYIGNTNRDADDIDSAFTVADMHGDRMGRLRFVIVVYAAL